MVPPMAISRTTWFWVLPTIRSWYHFRTNHGMDTVPIVSVGDAVTWRVERDSLGEVRVPAGALYGANAVRAVANFRVSGLTCAERPELLRALGQVKAASARANAELGVVSDQVAEAI